MSEPATPEPDEPTEPDQPSEDDEEGEAEQAETPSEPEPEPVAIDAQPSSQAEMERIGKQLDNEAKRHEKAVARIMGEDFVSMIPSPLDYTPGYLWNPAIVPVPENVKAMVLGLFGMQADAELRDDPDKRTCEVCDGLGMLKTGSRAPSQDALPCSHCQGKGWVQIIKPPAAVAPLPPPQQGGTVGGVPPLTDQWGRPLGHPHFNLAPSSVGA